MTAAQWTPGIPLDGVEELNMRMQGNVLGILSDEGGRVITAGDWIVVDSQGKKSVFSNSEFVTLFRAVP